MELRKLVGVGCAFGVLLVGLVSGSTADPLSFIEETAEAAPAAKKAGAKPVAKASTKPTAKSGAKSSVKSGAPPASGVVAAFKGKPSDPPDPERTFKLEAGGASCVAKVNAKKSSHEQISACADTSNCCSRMASGDVLGVECVDIKNDRFNCGGCGRTCSNGLECREGTCVCVNYEDEKGAVKDLCGGACVNIAGADTSNCGACGKSCQSGQICDSGKCTAFKCEAGRKMCGNYCADLQNDDADCGVCGHQCSDGFRCVGGRCRP